MSGAFVAGSLPGLAPPRRVSALCRKWNVCATASEAGRGRVPLWWRNVLQGAGLIENPDGIPVMTKVGMLTSRPDDYLDVICDCVEEYGAVFKVVLGPKAFVVVADPVAVKAVLKDSAEDYDKGLLTEVLDEIMGTGLIPAPFPIWRRRRKEIAPAFHRAWIQRMVDTMDGCARRTISQLKAENRENVDMESVAGRIALDIIGKAVFNFDFGGAGGQDVVVDAVYEVMQEAEHRAMFILPYWRSPLKYVVPRQRRFQQNMKIIQATLRDMIYEAIATKDEGDVETLEARDYASLENPSLLRFLVDLRGADTSEAQLRDDLMTLLIAGHETTAAVVTWTIFELTQSPEWLEKVQREVDLIIGSQTPTIGLIREMVCLRAVLSETLRMYPQPALLIRRAVRDTELPMTGPDGKTRRVPIQEGSDFFIVTYALHRSERLWPKADRFDPSRWDRTTSSTAEGWAGYSPPLSWSSGALYPTEVQADFAFLPFGGGQRKCVGDQFGFLESAIMVARLVQSFDPELATDRSNVRLTTGATIHAQNGVPIRLKPRTATRPTTHDHTPHNLQTRP